MPAEEAHSPHHAVKTNKEYRNKRRTRKRAGSYRKAIQFWRDFFPNCAPVSLGEQRILIKKSPHPDKTEFMLMSRRKFIGPLQCIKLGGNQIKQVVSSRCLGLQIDCNLGWSSHVSDLILSFSQKLNLLKSLYFLPINAKLDFYFKVVLPSITYGILIWGSCGKTLFDELERIHVRSAKVIFGLDWYTSGKDVLAKVKWFTLNNMPTIQLQHFKLDYVNDSFT